MSTPADSERPVPNKFSCVIEPETMKPSTEPTPAPKLKLPVGRSTTSTDMATRLGTPSAWPDLTSSK
jgi:hypothetical protein